MSVTTALANTLHMVRFGMRALDIATMHLINLALFVVVMSVDRAIAAGRTRGPEVDHGVGFTGGIDQQR